MSGKAIVSLIIGLIVVGVNGKQAAYAQAFQAETCVTSECHTTIGKDAPYIHGPVGAGVCSPCHQPVPGSATEHAFQPIVNVGATCYQCHLPKDTMGVVHPPVAKGECTACHDPHKSEYRFQLKKGNPMSDLCFSCHDQTAIMGKEFKHGPAAAGDCTLCHTPHTTDTPKLLLRQGNNLCFRCHTDKKKRLEFANYVHKPAAEWCVNCHNPHSNNAKFMLSQDVPFKCFECHQEMEQHIAGVMTNHKAIEIDKMCLNCHNPHEAQYQKQLIAQPMDLCLGCHNEEIVTEDTGTIINMAEWLDNNLDWHGPIRDRNCPACHNPHGSENFRILKRNYPKEFYISFDQDQYALCLGCHPPSLVQTPKTTTLTGFRKGDKNLHYVHVNRREKGRTCRACHETHASNKPKHIRDAVPFGTWMLPTRFEKTEDGGKCAPGCHVPREYSRTLSTPASGQ